MDHTHGPLDLQRLTDLTIGIEGLVISLSDTLHPREDRGEEPPCVCTFFAQICKGLAVVQPGGYIVWESHRRDPFHSLNVHHSMLFSFNLLTIVISSQLSVDWPSTLFIPTSSFGGITRLVIYRRAVFPLVGGGVSRNSDRSGVRGGTGRYSSNMVFMGTLSVVILSCRFLYIWVWGPGRTSALMSAPRDVSHVYSHGLIFVSIDFAPPHRDCTPFRDFAPPRKD